MLTPRGGFTKVKIGTEHADIHDCSPARQAVEPRRGRQGAGSFPLNFFVDYIGDLRKIVRVRDRERGSS